ncbi:MAG: inositol monophosphatase [Candidatus Omnitrophica bacterium]|nr:inositol monophosphatase [Candidatus Omnitrophota bacterium]
MDSEKVRSTLLKSLEGAGSILKETILERRVMAHKTELSLVTESDHRSEELIVRNILKQFPDHSILTEESPARGKSPYRWIVDPLDGTTNFAHTYPIACISIAFEDHGEVTFGGVYDPFRDELFYAEKGHGATLNSLPIVVSQNPVLAKCLLSTGFPYDRREHPDDYLAIFKSFMFLVQGIRRTGAAALDLAYVACGRFDGFWESKLMTWDIAAAHLIVEEAGGKLSDFSGKPLSLRNLKNELVLQTVASNGFIHEEMIKVLK